jgi:hypothetical protein
MNAKESAQYFDSSLSYQPHASAILNFRYFSLPSLGLYNDLGL